MTDAKWLEELKAMFARQAGDDDPAEQVALPVQELLDAAPADELRSAYLASTGGAGDPVEDALAAACERRNIDI